jgi:S1-C subfamily serine protease
VSELIVDLVNTLATDEKRPQYVVVPDARAKRPLSGLFLGVAGNPAPGGGYAIRSVLPNLPAQKAGLREGDVIVRFGDSEIKEPDDLMRAILKQKPGDRVRLKVRRGTEQLDIDVTLGGSP